MALDLLVVGKLREVFTKKEGPIAAAAPSIVVPDGLSDDQLVSAAHLREIAEDEFGQTRQRDAVSSVRGVVEPIAKCQEA